MSIQLERAVAVEAVGITKIEVELTFGTHEFTYVGA